MNRPTEIKENRMRMGRRPSTTLGDIERAEQRMRWAQQNLTKILRYEV